MFSFVKTAIRFGEISKTLKKSHVHLAGGLMVELVFEATGRNDFKCTTCLKYWDEFDTTLKAEELSCPYCGGS